MSVIRSKIKTSGAEFQAAAKAMRERVAVLEARLAQVRQGGDASARERHQARGKMLPRERVAGLLDEGSSFFEFSTLAAWDVYDEAVPAAGLITGFGTIGGRRCVIVANDATV